MCAVSYTTLPKRARRSLDTLLVFSCPMKGDMQLLTWEYCQNQAAARFALNSLKDYQCLVLETLEKSQNLFVWRADLLALEENKETEELPARGLSETEPSREIREEHPLLSHQNNTFSAPDCIQSPEPGEYSGAMV